ncbi:hypothetical protein D9757_007273 [Collybiopsis confluens]|uniref:Uncharacterized protein n=1 Tax=Collybiopsis confluens TaxID=2823264 RepID=A0A8H5HGG1_9AGAR|nr:hypothetical protein D9757_007273 [Collybiopsis confluens]
MAPSGWTELYIIFKGKVGSTEKTAAALDPLRLEELRYTMESAGSWELLGNILVQRTVEGRFTCFQFPSAHRNVLERTWTVEPENPQIIQEFGIDPGQDLLIVIEKF